LAYTVIAELAHRLQLYLTNFKLRPEKKTISVTLGCSVLKIFLTLEVKPSLSANYSYSLADQF